MKVAIITDQHFGARNDSINFLDFFEKFYNETFFPKLEEEGINTVLILGDTFDRRKYLNFNTLKRAKEMFFDPLAYMGIDVHILAGNHDTYFKNTNEVNSVDLLLKEYSSSFNVIDHPAEIYVGPHKICMMPWICADNYEDSMQMLKNTDARYCMGHFEIAGFPMYRGMHAEEGLSHEMFARYERVLSGHYHTRSKQENIEYIGTPYEMTWQDSGDPKGFSVFDTETRELTFHQNPFTIHEKIEYNDKEQEPIDLITLNLKDKYIKLVVINKTDLYKFDRFVNTLYEQEPYEVKIIEDLSEFNEGTIDAEINLEDTVSILGNYIDSVQTEGDKEAIKTFVKSLYIEAINQEVV